MVVARDGRGGHAAQIQVQVRNLAGEKVECEALLVVRIGRRIKLSQIIRRISSGRPLIVAGESRFIRFGRIRPEEPFAFLDSVKSRRIFHQRSSHGRSVELLVEIIKVDAQ